MCNYLLRLWLLQKKLFPSNCRFVSMTAAVLHKNSPGGTEITKVIATDLDSESNGAVTYDLVSGDSGMFKLDRNTGSLFLTRTAVDVQPRYQLTVRATDEAIQSQRKSSELYLMILSASEKSDANGLTFDQVRYSGSISENEPIGSSILTVSASLGQKSEGVGGSGAASSASVEYYITNITSPDGVLQNRLFDIDVKRGTLSSAAILDREMGVWDFQLEIYAIVVSAQSLTTASTKVSRKLVSSVSFHLAHFPLITQVNIWISFSTWRSNKERKWLQHHFPSFYHLTEQNSSTKCIATISIFKEYWTFSFNLRVNIFILFLVHFS